MKIGINKIKEINNKNTYTVHPEVDPADEVEPENSKPQVPRRCNTPIPQVRGRYDDVHMQGGDTLTYVR